MLRAPSAWCQRFPQLLHATTTAGTPPPPTTKPPVSGCIVNSVSSMMENWLWPHLSQGLFAPLRCNAEASSLSRVGSISCSVSFGDGTTDYGLCDHAANGSAWPILPIDRTLVSDGNRCEAHQTAADSLGNCSKNPHDQVACDKWGPA
jgi:hypothetical protein